MTGSPSAPDWLRLLAARRRLQALLPGAVLVGGTAAALHLHHRKAWLLLERRTVRDFVDAVALLERLGEAALPTFARTFASDYERGPDRGPVLVELVEALAAADPADAAAVDLSTYEDVRPPWNDLAEVRRRARVLSARLAALAMTAPPGDDPR